MKTIPIYNHQKTDGGLSCIEIELHLHNRNEDHLRKLCRDFNPKTHGISGDHVLRGCLPGALKLEPDTLRALNQILPGVIYTMPKVVKYLTELSCTAVRETNLRKAKMARAKLLQIVMPVDADRETTPITPHSTVLIKYVAEDFYLVSELFKRERDLGVSVNQIVSAITKCFRDIDPKWIKAICKPTSRISELVYRRAGEFTGSKGRGEYEAWRKENPGYLARIKADAKNTASGIELPYP
ncbi:MAG: hypothetical protein RBT03_05440 [Kiritimatiellia bacterium]|jgi:hypothetical protein|nr:hypothetical protein [Kiritimatiellia bacterium]